MRILLDEGLPRTAAERLRSLGLDAVHTGECGLSAAADKDVLQFARRERRIVITLDADFHSLIALSAATKPSVIRVRIMGLRAEPLVRLLIDVLERCRKNLHQGAVVSVTRDQIRLRHLPLRAARPRRPRRLSR